MTTATLQPEPKSTGRGLLDPRALAAVSRLELVSKQFMDGYVQGLHKSRHIGFALDFAQHRQYVPGDDVKRIDWRVYAKADRYYIKQYEVTTNLQAHIVVDASASMKYTGADAHGQPNALSKFRYAQFLAMCLSYLVLHQQDSAGLVTFSNRILDFLPARSIKTHLMTIAAALDRTQPADESAIAPILHDIAERITTRGMVVIISDFFDDAAALLEALHHLKHKRHEVILLQVLAHDELTFPFRKFTEFANLEKSTDRLRLDPALMRARYLENLAAHLHAIRTAAGAMAMSHDLLDTSEPFEKTLAGYLARRMGSR